MSAPPCSPTLIKTEAVQAVEVGSERALQGRLSAPMIEENLENDVLLTPKSAHLCLSMRPFTREIRAFRFLYIRRSESDWACVYHPGISVRQTRHV